MLMACLFFRGFCDSHREKSAKVPSHRKLHLKLAHVGPIVGPLLVPYWPLFRAADFALKQMRHRQLY